MRNTLAVLASLLFVVTTPAIAAWGERDCSFGNAGLMTVPGAFGPMYGAISEPGGSILARLGFLSTGGDLYRIDAAGTSATDLGISSAVGMTSPVDALQPDGRIVFSNGANSPNPIGVGRFLAAGGIDTSFGTNGYATVPGLTAMSSGPLLQPDGKIVVAAKVNGGAALVRFNADGTPDSSFGSSGVAPNPQAHVDGYQSLALQPDGKIVAVSRTTLSRHAADGQVDAAFGSAGNVTFSFPYAWQVGLQPSGKILVYRSVPFRLYRYESNGALDTTVGGGTGYREPYLGSFWSPHIALSMMADGRPVLVGQYGQSGHNSGILLRYGVDLQDETLINLSFPPTVGAILAGGRVLLGHGGQVGRVFRLLGDADPSTCITTTTALTSSPNPSTFGQGVQLTATVTPSSAAPAQGSIQFKLGGAAGTNMGSPVTLVNGVATLAASSLVEGSNTFTAVYIPTGAYLEGTSPTHTHIVTPRTPTMTTLGSAPNPSNAGQVATLTATVAPQSGPGTPAGTVQFRDGITHLGSPVALSSGTATLNISTLGDGSHSLNAVYSGDPDFAPSTSGNVTHVVPGRLTVNDPTANAAQGAASMTFSVTLTAPSQSTVTVAYATSDRSAKAGTDYTITSGSLTFDPGQTSKTVPVPITQGPVGPSKDFFLTLSSPANASLAKGAGIGTITYIDNSTLALYVADTAVVEGPAGVTLIGFNVTLSRPHSSQVTVQYTTANGSAIAGADYTAQSGSLAFPSNVTQRWVMVPVLGNTTVDGNRTLFLNLSNPTVAAIGRGQGTATIFDDDPTPAASTVSMLRLYSDVTKEHLYTTDGNEYAILGTRGWVQEGTAYTMFANAGTYGSQVSIPLYRMYHPGILQHHWTPDANEVMVLASQGAWHYEGISGYLLAAAEPGSTPLYRLMYYNPPLHLWTRDLNEKDVLSAQYGWVYEGVVGEVLP